MKIFNPVFDGELISVGDKAVAQTEDDKMFQAATGGGDYLPRLQLMTSASEVCKKGEFPINHFAIVRDQNYHDVGESLDLLVIAWRPKAMEMDEEVITSFDPTTELFQDIQARSSQADSGCMFGPEFLCYAPDHDVYTTFFMGSKSLRREAPNMKARLQKAATLKPKLIETKKYSWYSTIVTACSTPFDVPPNEDILAQVEKFKNPPEPEIEKAADDSGDDRAR